MFIEFNIPRHKYVIGKKIEEFITFLMSEITKEIARDTPRIEFV